MSVSPKQAALRRAWIGHGLLVMVSGLVGGLFAIWSNVGGIEYMPGRFIEFELPGTPEGWLKTHTGPISNSVMVLVMALSIPLLDLSDVRAARAGWSVIASAWANVAFYYLANFSPNRAQALGPSRMGPANIYSWLALLPTVFTNMYMLGVFVILGFEAVFKAGTPEDTKRKK